MKSIIFIVISILITSCSNSNSKDTELMGHWRTQACTQAVDLNDVLVDFWFKADYEFTSNGYVIMNLEKYTDAQCIAKAQTIESLDTVASYTDQGETTLQEGIQGHGFTLSFPIPDKTSEIDGYYTVNNGVLCFSGIYIFSSLEFGFSEVAGDSSINFDNCLVKLKPTSASKQTYSTGNTNSVNDMAVTF
jgi:hypothetical protein